MMMIRRRLLITIKMIRPMGMMKAMRIGITIWNIIYTSFLCSLAASGSHRRHSSGAPAPPSRNLSTTTTAVVVVPNTPNRASGISITTVITFVPNLPETVATVANVWRVEGTREVDWWRVAGC